MSAYDGKTLREIIDDYVLIRGDLVEEYGRDQLAEMVLRSAEVAKVKADACALGRASGPSLKPDEPTGLGAVVEDGAGQHWIKICTCNQGRDWSDFAANNKPWDQVDAARILSPGFTP